MILTKQDLTAITGIVQTETSKIVQSETRKIVREELKPVNTKLASIDKRLTKVEKDLTKTINFFDKEHLAFKSRLEKVEYKSGIPASKF